MFADARACRVENRALTVEKRRWSGAASVFIPVRYLRTDQWGTWVLAPPLTAHRGATGALEHIQAVPIVGLIPSDGLYTAWFKPHGGKIDLSASNVIDFGRSTVTFVDVELDIDWIWDQPARLIDEDEFEELALTDTLRSLIAAEAEAVRLAIDAGHGAFGEPARGEVAAAVEAHGDGHGIPDGFAPVGPGLAPFVADAFGGEVVAEHESGEDAWLLAGMCAGKVCALVRIAPDRVEVIGLRDELRDASGQELALRAGRAAAMPERPPR